MMGITQHFQRKMPTTMAAGHRTVSKSFWPLFASNFVLSALSITNLGLISSMVGFLLNQKHNVRSYKIDFQSSSFQLNVEPAHLWVDQGHESNGVAGYGFFLGLFGMFVAWRVRKSTVRPHVLVHEHLADIHQRPLKSLIALLILQLFAILFTLSALIFVFIITYRTTG